MKLSSTLIYYNKYLHSSDYNNVCLDKKTYVYVFQLFQQPRISCKGL